MFIHFSHAIVNLCFFELKSYKIHQQSSVFFHCGSCVFRWPTFHYCDQTTRQDHWGHEKKNQWACQNLHFFRANLRMTNSRTSVQQLKVVCLEFIREHLMESNRHVVVAVNVHSTPYYLFDITLLFLQICLPT